jgi:hypothetical protein
MKVFVCLFKTELKALKESVLPDLPRSLNKFDTFSSVPTHLNEFSFITYQQKASYEGFPGWQLYTL